MFIGHFALAFAAKRAAPRASLGALFAAAQWPDLLWPLLLLAGVERVAVVPGDTPFTPLRFDAYPVSHSLLATALWALGAAGLYLARRRGDDAPGGRRAAVVLALLVLSHWVLDLVTHRPDLPLTPWGEARLGLGLWGSVAATVVVETLLFALGVGLYLRASRPVDRRGRYGLAALVGFLALTYVMNLAGDPPPSWQAVAWVTLALWLLVPWAAWVDRHSRPDAR